LKTILFIKQTAYLMAKVNLPAKLRMDFPLPTAVISYATKTGKPNLITVGAVSGACHNPPMWGVAIGHTRHSYGIMKETDGFVINIPSRKQVDIVDYCGSKSGRDVDKFKECGLTAHHSSYTTSPMIMEFPINIECLTRQMVDLGGHQFFFGEIVAVHCDEAVLNDKGGVDKEQLNPMCSFLNSYWGVGDELLGFGKYSLSRLNPSNLT
jgi:flavin reductase (DIM6/NTAB) family NADH-FMN oxidoreductase RutF